jgi:hypothetical protein
MTVGMKNLTPIPASNPSCREGIDLELELGRHDGAVPDITNGDQPKNEGPGLITPSDIQKGEVIP